MTLPTRDRVAFSYPEQAAAAAGVPIASIVAAVQSGSLVTRQAGASKVILRADLERYVASLPATPKSSLPQNIRKTAGYAQGRALAVKLQGKKA
jgi:hypothetical protein